jgi:hypothetical protein
LGSDSELTSLFSLKREVEILYKALTENDQTEQSEQIQKLLFYTDKLIELSRMQHNSEPIDPKELAVWNMEITEFQQQHPASPDDLIRLQPYKEVIEKVTEQFIQP